MYLDTAILVKLLVREPDSDFYAGLVDGQPAWSYAPPRRATLELGEKPQLLEAPGEPERRWWDAFIER